MEGQLSQSAINLATGDGAASCRPLTMGRSVQISAGHYLAAHAGTRVFQAGGTAIDAGIAAVVALNVVAFDRTGIAGVAPIILHRAETGEVVTLDGLGVWPRAMDLDRLRASRAASGILRSVTPGAPDAWMTALSRFGTLTLGEVLEPAHELASAGAPISGPVAASIDEWEAAIAPEELADFFPDGMPRCGEVFAQPALASVVRALMDEEAAARRAGLSREDAIMRARNLFYRGWIAEEISAFHRQQEGWLQLSDFVDHRVEVERPTHTRYHGYDIYGCGPWCQGPVLLEALNIVDQFDLERLGHNTPEYLHLLLEALDLAFADRENYFGDPRYVRVPLSGLLSKEYAAARARSINPGRATARMPDPGDPWQFDQGGQGPGRAPLDVSRYRVDKAATGGDTSYVAAVDAAGNLFSATPSDWIFDGPVIPKLGLACSARGVQSRVDPDHPSVAAPGKRPRLTPNPALIMLDGKPLMAIGCSGGDAQTQGMLQVLLGMIHFGLDPQQALEAPRVASENFPNSFAPHPYRPGRVISDGRMPAQAIDSLRALGHDVHVGAQWNPETSCVQLAGINPANGTLVGASDPRIEGASAGW